MGEAKNSFICLIKKLQIIAHINYMVHSAFVA